MKGLDLGNVYVSWAGLYANVVLACVVVGYARWASHGWRVPWHGLPLIWWAPISVIFPWLGVVFLVVDLVQRLRNAWRSRGSARGR